MASGTIKKPPNIMGDCCIANKATGSATTLTLTLETGNTQTLFVFASTRWASNNQNYRTPSIYNLAYAANSGSPYYTFAKVAESPTGTPVTLSVAQDASNPKKFTLTASIPHTELTVIGSNPFVLA